MLKKVIIILFLSVFAFNWATAGISLSQVAQKTLFGKRYAELGRIAEYFQLKSQVSQRSFKLLNSAKRSVAVFEADKRAAVINSMPVVLNFAPALQKGKAYISWNDFTTTLLPLLQRSSLRKHTPVRIVIDPGHGGDDPGASGKLSREKNITLAIAKELKKELEKQTFTIGGKATKFQVFLTRSSDYSMSLEQRARHCTRLKGQLFISIHADAATPSATGIGTFSFTPSGAPSYNTGKVEAGVAPGHAWSSNSLFLAYCVQKDLASAIRSTPNRGIKRARFSVLRNTNCPAILVETGFISNREEERKLNMPSYRKQLAAAIADGVLEYQKQVGRK